jgi:protein-glutamine gamma-glutamyltransferase
MNAALRRLRSEAILLGGISLLLAMADNIWWYPLAVLIGGMIGYWSLARRSRPLLSTEGGLVFGLAAFGLLIVEWGWLINTPTVMALSHFMILIAISKWLQPRTRRDDAMMLVLLLLLLVVGAIVGGNLMFPVVLAAYMIVGLQSLIRYHVDRQSARVHLRNALIQGTAPAEAPWSAPAVRGLRSISVSTGAAALIIGSIVFVAMPRVGAGMLGQVPPPVPTAALSGFARSIEFTSASQIAESDRLVMRLEIADEDGHPLAAGIPLYLRGDILDRYSRRFRWGYRRGNVSEGDATHYDLVAWDDGPPRTLLFPEKAPLPRGSMLIQKYRLEPTDDLTLFACYPPLEITSPSLPAVRKSTETQSLQSIRPIRRPLEYSIRSPGIAITAANALAAERGSADVPPIPEPELPAEQRERVLRLIEEQTRGIGSPELPENRLPFARKLEAFLQSPPFTYTLQPPPLPGTGDPVSHFLLEGRRGHCEYFASALAVMCQLKGVPARVVVGYMANDYNSLGGFYLVRKKHAHAWVEVFVPGMDWVALDPTPMSDRRPGTLQLYGLRLRAYIDFLQFQWADGVLSFDSETRRRLFDQFAQWLRRPAQDQRTPIGGLVAFVRELFGWRLELSWKERLVYWVFTLLVVVLVVLVTYVVVSTARRLAALARQLSQTRRSGRVRRSREVEFYHRFCRYLAGLGLTRRSDQTPAEFAADLADQNAAFSEAPTLVQAYYDVAFGGKPLSAPRRTHLEDFLTRLGHLDRERLNQVQPQH